MALQRFLERLLTRSALSAEEQQAVLNLQFRTVQYRPRADIVSPGQTVAHSCLVSKGLVGRFDEMRDGKRQIVAFHIPGDMADLHSVVAPTAAWGLAALTPTTALNISHSQLRSLATAYPNLATAFWRDCVADGSILAKWVGNLGRQDARARLAHLLCEMGMRFESAGLGTRTCFIFDATQEQLADALGLTAVHVNRTMQALRRENLIVTRSHTIEVTDWNGLAGAADFEPAYLLMQLPSRSTLPQRGSEDRHRMTAAT
jgi:CRP-like cAMP-binding protein